MIAGRYGLSDSGRPEAADVLTMGADVLSKDMDFLGDGGRSEVADVVGQRWWSPDVNAIVGCSVRGGAEGFKKN